MSGSFDLVLNIEETFEYIVEVYPACKDRIVIERLEPMSARIRYKVFKEDWRPGGTVSGPTIFTSADAAMWIMVLAMVGKKALSVTSSANIYFLRKPSMQDLINEVTLLKLGKNSSVGDCLIYSEGGGNPVAKSSLTYFIPS